MWWQHRQLGRQRQSVGKELLWCGRVQWGSMLIGVLIHLFECWLGSSIEDRWFGKDEIADFGEGFAAEQGQGAPEDLELV